MPDAFEHEAAQLENCRLLWRSVMEQAVEDAFAEPGRIANTAKRRKAVQERGAARAFLLAEGNDFETVCALAGMDGDVVGRLVREGLAGKAAPVKDRNLGTGG